MPVTVRFSNAEECPCPQAIKLGNPASKKAWELSRGTPVVLEGVCPLENVWPEHVCGSDTYWWVKCEGPIAIANRLTHPLDQKPVIVCRHVLDIGD